MKGIRKEWENVGEEWGSVLGCGGDEKRCRGCGKVWGTCEKSV